MTTISSSPTQNFADFTDFKSGALLWFSQDTNSPWGTSFPISVPVQKKQPIGLGKDSKIISKPLADLSSYANEFVQVSSNQRWNHQNIAFGQIQNELNVNKKALKSTISSASSANTVVVVPDVNENSMYSENSTGLADDDSIPQNLYKTELCRSFEETGTCRYGLKCQFAHGRAELRPVSRHPKYKTEVCKTFHTIGTCPYGKRCRFIHTEAPTAAPQTASSSNSLSAAAKTITPPKSEIKAPVMKTSALDINIFGANDWSTNWNSSFQNSSSTNVNFNSVAKNLPSKKTVEVFSPAVNSQESIERKSRLGIFQQICS